MKSDPSRNGSRTLQSFSAAIFYGLDGEKIWQSWGRTWTSQARKFLFSVLQLCSLSIFAVSIFGSVAAAQPSPERHVSSSLKAEQRNPAPGSVIDLAIWLVPDAGWHTYWKNPGDSGMESTVQWSLPRGARTSSLRYPVPDRLLVGGLMNYVYGKPHALLLKLKVPDSAEPGSVFPIRGKFDYLVCTEEECIPETADLALDVTIAVPGSPPQTDPSFQEFRRKLPVVQPTPARLEQAGGKLRLSLPAPASMKLEESYFFPSTDGVIPYAAPQQIEVVDGLVVVEVASSRVVSSVEGVLRLDEGVGLAIKAADQSLATISGKDTSSTALSALLAFGAAVLGGLLLNFLPCVFPILSLKALSLANGGISQRSARREAIAYTAGAVAICLALGATVLAFRSGGASVGWAFQLQDPRMILALLLLMVGIGLNLAGLYELPSLSAGGRLADKGVSSGAFWTGALAAFAATPCTGPFMAGALGAALVLPIPAALAIFLGLGVGLALPFLVVGFVPAARRHLPRPGPWLARVRPILSVPMFLTVLGLAWVLGRQAGVNGMTLGLGAALVLSLLLWWLGKGGERHTWLRLVPAALTLVVGPAVLTSVMQEAERARPLSSIAFSEDKTASLLQERRPVFAYFTADWCITCKVNEKTVLNQKVVVDAFEKNNVAVLVGDWTTGDPQIGEFLKSQGRSGVPLYVYYKPGRDPVVLSQLLTVSEVLAILG